jgi:hypothetical protein
MNELMNHANVHYGVTHAEYIVRKEDLNRIINHAVSLLETSPFPITSNECYESVYGGVDANLTTSSSKNLNEFTSEDDEATLKEDLADDQSLLQVSSREVTIDVMHRKAAMLLNVPYGSKQDDQAWLSAWEANTKYPLRSTIVAYQYAITGR